MGYFIAFESLLKEFCHLLSGGHIKRDLIVYIVVTIQRVWRVVHLVSVVSVEVVEV